MQVAKGVRLFATYCSAEKESSSKELPAIERYLSQRIRGLKAMADESGGLFGILSGRFGLIAAEHAIPYYDHLMGEDEVDGWIGEVSATLREWGVSEVRWFSVAFEVDPNVRRYHAVMAGAAAAVGAEFVWEVWGGGL